MSITKARPGRGVEDANEAYQPWRYSTCMVGCGYSEVARNTPLVEGKRQLSELAGAVLLLPPAADTTINDGPARG